MTFPALRRGFIYGLTLTFARPLGEFGAVLVIGGGVQGRTETATLFIYCESCCLINLGGWLLGKDIF